MVCVKCILHDSANVADSFLNVSMSPVSPNEGDVHVGVYGLRGDETRILD